MRGSRTVSPSGISGADRKSGARRAGGDCAVKMNLSAPAIWPEIAAEAPTTGAISPKWQTRWVTAPATPHITEKTTNLRSPTRRATALPKASIHSTFTTRCTQPACTTM